MSSKRLSARRRRVVVPSVFEDDQGTGGSSSSVASDSEEDWKPVKAGKKRKLKKKKKKTAPRAFLSSSDSESDGSSDKEGRTGKGRAKKSKLAESSDVEVEKKKSKNAKEASKKPLETVQKEVDEVEKKSSKAPTESKKTRKKSVEDVRKTVNEVEEEEVVTDSEDEKSSKAVKSGEETAKSMKKMGSQVKPSNRNTMEIEAVEASQSVKDHKDALEQRRTASPIKKAPPIQKASGFMSSAFTTMHSLLSRMMPGTLRGLSNWDGAKELEARDVEEEAEQNVIYEVDWNPLDKEEADEDSIYEVDSWDPLDPVPFANDKDVASTSGIQYSMQNTDLGKDGNLIRKSAQMRRGEDDVDEIMEVDGLSGVKMTEKKSNDNKKTTKDSTDIAPPAIPTTPEALQNPGVILKSPSIDSHIMFPSNRFQLPSSNGILRIFKVPSKKQIPMTKTSEVPTEPALPNKPEEMTAVTLKTGEKRKLEKKKKSGQRVVVLSSDSESDVGRDDEGRTGKGRAKKSKLAESSDAEVVKKTSKELAKSKETKKKSVESVRKAEKTVEEEEIVTDSEDEKNAEKSGEDTATSMKKDWKLANRKRGPVVHRQSTFMPSSLNIMPTLISRMMIGTMSGVTYWDGAFWIEASDVEEEAEEHSIYEVDSWDALDPVPFANGKDVPSSSGIQYSMQKTNPEMDGNLIRKSAEMRREEQEEDDDDIMEIDGLGVQTTKKKDNHERTSMNSTDSSTPAIPTTPEALQNSDVILQSPSIHSHSLSALNQFNLPLQALEALKQMSNRASQSIIPVIDLESDPQPTDNNDKPASKSSDPKTYRVQLPASSSNSRKRKLKPATDDVFYFINGLCIQHDNDIDFYVATISDLGYQIQPEHLEAMTSVSACERGVQTWYGRFRIKDSATCEKFVEWLQSPDSHEQMMKSNKDRHGDEKEKYVFIAKFLNTHVTIGNIFIWRMFLSLDPPPGFEVIYCSDSSLIYRSGDNSIKLSLGDVLKSPNKPKMLSIYESLTTDAQNKMRDVARRFGIDRDYWAKKSVITIEE